MFSAGAEVFSPEPEFFLPEPEVKNPEFAQHYSAVWINGGDELKISFRERSVRLKSHSKQLFNIKMKTLTTLNLYNTKLL